MSSLMQHDVLAWDNDILSELFNDREVGIIRGIPLRLWRQEVKWSWSFDRRGVYSVRSSYDFLLQSSSLVVEPSSLWSLIWSIKIPPTVKCLIWRASLNILPIVDNHQKKHVVVENICLFCCGNTKSIMHIFVDFFFARNCWYSSIVGYCRGSSVGFADCLLFVLSKNYATNKEYIAMIIWQLWNNRNSIIWKGRGVPLASLVQAGMLFLERWTISQNSNMKSPHIARSFADVKWSKPSNGWLKCNVNAGVFQACGMIGSGVVLHSCHGYFVAARSKVKYSSVLTPSVAEALSFRETLS